MPQKRLGFFDGVSAFFGGLGFLLTRPALWPWALVPMLLAGLLLGGLGAVAIWSAAELAQRLLAGSASAWTTAGYWALRVFFSLVGLVVAFLVAMALAQPLSGFALDAIARRQELALGGRAWPDQPFVASALRSLRVTLTALAISLPILGVLSLVTLLFPPASVVTVPLKFVVTGLAVAYDFLDYPLGQRGMGVRARMAFMGRHPLAVLGFGAAAALVLLVPGVGLVVLPAGVAGATRMVVRSE